MTLVQLRRKGPLVEPITRPFTDIDQPPRALRGLAKIVEEGLCHRCGSCVGICPTNVLGLDEQDYPIVKHLSACTDCELCVRVCPGDELDVHSINRQMFGEPQKLDDVHGFFETGYLSYATDAALRQNSSSGGAVTAILISLLKRGEIDGAIVIGSDPGVPWKGEPLIARTAEELLASTKSKYAISPTNVAFQEVTEQPGRYAYVGLPCQIHGYHKAARLDRRLRDRIVLTIGLFCHAATEHDPVDYIWKQIEHRHTKKPVRYIPREGKHPGTPMIEFEDGSREPAYFPEHSGYRPSSTEMLNVLYRLYTPERCLTCYDSTSEFADISVGDPWMAPPSKDINFYEGYSFLMSRTARAKDALARCEAAGDLKLLALPKEVSRECNLETALEKRYRAFRVIETRRRQGYGVPDYRLETPHMSGIRFVRVEINMLTHVLCYLPKLRKHVLRFILSPAGYWLFWLNHQRRVLRVAIRNRISLLRRRYVHRLDPEILPHPDSRRP